MISKLYKPLFIFVFIYLILIVLINFGILSLLKKNQGPSLSFPASKQNRLPARPAPQKSKNFLLPDNPLGYNIVEQKRLVPHNQQQWDEYMSHALKETGVERRLRDPKNAAGLQKSQQDIEQQRRYLDTLIKSYEGTANTLDEQGNKKLQELYMLRSSLDRLSHEITSKK